MKWKYLIVFVVVLFGVGLALGLGYWRGKGINRKSVVEVDSRQVLDKKMEFQEEATEQVVKAVEEKSGVKGKKVRFIPHAVMPDSDENIETFTFGSTWGKDGIGAACSKPKTDTDGKTIEVDIYITLDQLIQSFGEEAAMKRINGVWKACLVKAMVGETISPDQYTDFYKQINMAVGEMKLIELAF